ncbi:hypothetical protein HK096_005069, partial [Nowakowskiella sp. JEL0078]
RTYQEEHLDVSKINVLKEVLLKEYPAVRPKIIDELLSAIEDPQIKEILDKVTKDVVDKGAFGLPTMLVTGCKDIKILKNGVEPEFGSLFWGIDKIPDIEFYLGIGPKLLRIRSREKVDLQFCPVFLPALFKEAENSTPLLVPAKARYMQDDLHRISVKMGMKPYVSPKKFPLNTFNVMKVLTAIKLSYPDKLELAMLAKSLHEDNKDISDKTVIAEVLSKEFLSSEPKTIETILTAMSEPLFKEMVISETKEAVKKGVFGVPAMFVTGGKDAKMMKNGIEPTHGSLFWGVDKIPEIERYLGMTARSQHSSGSKL